jgi:hypothetical protein
LYRGQKYAVQIKKTGLGYMCDSPVVGILYSLGEIQHHVTHNSESYYY